MAENTENMDNIHGQFREELYEQQWIISDWDAVQRSENAVRDQSFEFTTTNSTRVQTKWKMGFKFQNPPTDFRAFWKLIDAKGFPDGNVDVTTHCTILNGDSSVYRTDTLKNVITVGKEVEVPGFLGFNVNNWGPWINPLGELVFLLKLTIMEPELLPVNCQLENFHSASVAQLCVNLADLLGDKSSTDLKIITSDGKELWAHKLILKARCPVFETMFRTDLSENQTGIVNVKDISAKTMGIFLHLFYSGELLPSWKDADTVVEFSYAVGKYQLTNVLELLDDVLGRRDNEDATHTDVQLLSLAQKLNLKTAEKELLERIKQKISQVNSGAEFFTMCGIGE